MEQELSDMSGGSSDEGSNFFLSSEDEGKNVRVTNKENSDPNVLGRGDNGKKEFGSSGMSLKNAGLGNTQSAGAKSSPKIETFSHSNAENVPKHPDAKTTIEKLKPYHKDLANWIESREGYNEEHHQDLLKATELLEDMCEENVTLKKKQAMDMKILQEVLEKEKAEECQVLQYRVGALEDDVMATVLWCSNREAEKPSLLNRARQFKAVVKRLEYQLTDYKQCSKSKSDSWKCEGMNLVRQLTSLQEENQKLKNQLDSVKGTEGSSEKCKGDKAEAPPELVTAFENACSEKRSLEANLRRINKKLYVMKKKVQELEKDAAVCSIRETCQEGMDYSSETLKRMEEMTGKFERGAEEILSNYENISSSSFNTPESAVLKNIENKYKEMAKDFQVKFIRCCQSEIGKHFCEKMSEADRACSKKFHEKFMYYSACLRKSVKKEFDKRLEKCVQEAKEKAVRDDEKVIKSLQKQLEEAKLERESLIEKQKSSNEKLCILRNEIFSQLQPCIEQLQLLSESSNNGVNSTQAECSTGAPGFQTDCPLSVPADHESDHPSEISTYRHIHSSSSKHPSGQAVASVGSVLVDEQMSSGYKSDHPSKVTKSGHIRTSSSTYSSAVSTSATHMDDSSPSVPKASDIFPSPSSNLPVQTAVSLASTTRAVCPSHSKKIKKIRRRSTSLSSCSQAGTVASPAHNADYPSSVPKLLRTYSSPSVFLQAGSSTGASAPYPASKTGHTSSIPGGHTQAGSADSASSPI